MVAWPRTFVTAAASQTAMSASDSFWIVRFMAIVSVGWGCGGRYWLWVVACWLLIVLRCVGCFVSAALRRNRSWHRKLAEDVRGPLGVPAMTLKLPPAQLRLPSGIVTTKGLLPRIVVPRD